MFKRIVVPLDGSEHAEAVLPWVERLAPVLLARVEVLRVVNLTPPTPKPGAQWPVSTSLYDRWLEIETTEAERYVAEVARRLRNAGCEATTRVAHGHTASAIIDASGSGPDSTLVAMATHGRSGLARFVMGSVAGQVVREVETPLLLVRPLAEQPRAFDSILVPLDGSTIAEAVLPAVESLAPALAARVVLVLAADAYDGMQPIYLETVEDRLRQTGIADVSHRLAAGPPAEAILDIANRERLSLIAMTTRARSGIPRWVFGSVAEHVLHAATVPTLLVRGQE